MCNGKEARDGSRGEQRRGWERSGRTGGADWLRAGRGITGGMRDLVGFLGESCRRGVWVAGPWKGDQGRVELPQGFAVFLGIDCTGSIYNLIFFSNILVLALDVVEPNWKQEFQREKNLLLSQIPCCLKCKDIRYNLNTKTLSVSLNSS